MAVFLDRDGVINVAKRGKWTDHEDDFELYPFTIEALKLIQETGAPIFVVTNQSGVARGTLLHSQYYAITAKMLRLFEQDDIKIARVFECLHPKDGSTRCICRKPEIGMLDRAVHEYEVGGQAWFVGDMSTDIEMIFKFNAESMACKITPIMVRTGLCDDGELNRAVKLAEEHSGDLFIEENLLTAAQRIYSGYSGSS
jgi:D-glycero-D-manno-heptose 1,7-bisphosphate phosphatase